MQYPLEPKTLRRVEEAARLRKRADDLHRGATLATFRVVKELTAKGIPLREVANITGLKYQRVVALNSTEDVCLTTRK